MARQNKAEIVLTARDRTKSAFAAVNRNLGRFAAVGVAGAAAGLVLLTRAGLRQIDALAKQAQLLGTTTEALAALQLVSAKTGVEQKTLEKSLINMTRVVAEAAEGTGLAVDTLAKLGLEAKSLSQQRPEDQFAAIADAMAGLNTQSEKVLAAYELFGGRGAALLRTLEAGSAAMDEAREKTERFGTAISAIDAKGVEDANDAFTDLQESVKGVGFDLARRFAPGMEAASTSTANFIVTIRRDVIPALVLMLEQMDLIISNVRGLTDVELSVRIEVQDEEIQRFNDRLAAAKKVAENNDPFAVLGGTRAALDAENTEALESLKAAAVARLEEIKSEQERRANIIIEADRKLEDQRKAQNEEARVARVEAERAADIEVFEERLEQEEERNSEFIQLALKRASEERRIRFGEAREEQRALDAQGRLEERASANTLAIRRATVTTSIQILQTLVGKNKAVAQALFLVEKGLAISRTVQNTAAAAVKALAELGPIAGPPAAAAIQAFGAAQVALIGATALAGVGSIGGGGGPGGLGGASFGGAGDFGGGGFDFPDQSIVQGEPASPQGVVQLVFPSLFGITPDAIDSLADALREATENRDIVVVSALGRNGEILQGANG